MDRITEARESLPAKLHATFDELVRDYKQAAARHTGKEWVGFEIIAELIFLGWRPMRASRAEAAKPNGHATERAAPTSKPFRNPTLKRTLALKILRLLRKHPQGVLVRALVDPCDAELRALGRPDRSQYLSSLLWVWVGKGYVGKRPSDSPRTGASAPNLYFLTEAGEKYLDNIDGIPKAAAREAPRAPRAARTG